MRMRVTDFHVHAFPDGLAAAAISALEQQGGVGATYDGTVAGLLGQMDRAGIARAVVQPVATKPGQVPAIGEWAARLAGDRIVPFGAMHPDVEDPAEEFERMRRLGLKGFKMHPEYQSFEPDEPRTLRVLVAAREAGMIALFHAGEDIGFDTVRGTPEAFARMLDAVPGLKVVLAHLGGFRCWEGVRRALLGRDVYLDTAYTLGHMPDDEYVALVRDHGVERVLFATDGPWTDMAGELERFRSLPFSEGELERMLSANAEELLGG